jgi:hypothetical protein
MIYQETECIFTVANDQSKFYSLSKGGILY